MMTVNRDVQLGGGPTVLADHRSEGGGERTIYIPI